MEIVKYNPSYESQLKTHLASFEREVEFSGRKISEGLIYSRVNDTMNEISRGLDNCVLALLDGQVVGFNITHLYKNNADNYRRNGSLELSQVYVSLEHRNKGVGKSLDSFCIELAEDESQVMEVITIVDSNSAANIRLKKRMGFRKTAQFSEGGSNYLVFKKKISKRIGTS
jgi:L-amino acid N-acyltransferase YncA